jgi:glycosyltransferase involved in cell wall biosynthesis
MKIFGIMVLKNEGDIVAHTLQSAAQWCDAIYVLDNGSDDGTWDLVKQLAQYNPAVVPHEQSFEPFTEFIRARLFNAYRDRAQDGDWWCRLDADEIYVESPRTMLTDVTSHEVLWAIHLQYYFTDLDLDRYIRNPELYNPSLPPAERFHFYRAEASEARFFLHRRRLRWESGAWPRHLGRICPRRILVRHYKFRSPSQIRRRLATRSEIFARGGSAGAHWRNTDWRAMVPRSADLDYDNGEGRFRIDERIIPNHVDPFWRAAAKSFMHGTGLWP